MTKSCKDGTCGKCSKCEQKSRMVSQGYSEEMVDSVLFGENRGRFTFKSKRDNKQNSLK